MSAGFPPRSPHDGHQSHQGQHPTAAGQNAEPYSYQNAPPSSSSHHAISLPSINRLAPIRNIEVGPLPSQQPLFQPPQQLPHHQQAPLLPPRFPPAQAHHFNQPQRAMGSQLPPPNANPMQLPPGQYYPAGQHPLPGPPHPPMGPNQDPNAPLRYPLPAQDSRMMSGGRHKKEIKRRTKTGCLTCRKRRIKCDEGHPTCRNCMKSKRECLGYDPIFKAQPGTTNIQPAPNASPSIHPPPPTSQYSVPPPGYASVPPQYLAAQMAPTAAASAHAQDYNAAIDPALQSAGTTSLYDGSHESSLGARPTVIEELLNVGAGMPPPAIPQQIAALTDKQRTDICAVWETIYGPAMNKIFEVNWFTKSGTQHLLNNPELCTMFLKLMDRFGITAERDLRENLITQSLEAHVIWQSLLLCRQVSAAVLSTNDSSSQAELDYGVHDAAKRLKAFEALITNQQLDLEFAQDMDRYYEPVKGPALDQQVIGRQRAFWKQIAIFSTLKDDSTEAPQIDPNMDPAMVAAQAGSPEAGKIDACLKEIRGLLDSFENRDILYSVAIARVVGQRMFKANKNGSRPDLAPVTNSEDDPKTKLYVARTFIQAESGGKGTNQVAQRICGMAIRAWGNR